MTARPMMLGQVAQKIVLPAISVGGSAATPAIAAAIFGKAAWAVPVVGAAIGGVTLALSVFLNRKLPRQKEIASQMVDELERELQKNLAGYQSSGRTQADQTLALANFDAAWAWLTSQEGCGSRELGTAGERCIRERERGGSAPWCPTGTGCDWFILYRDPIANDETAKAAANVGGGFLSEFFGERGAEDGPGEGSISPGLLLALGLIGVGVALS